MGSEPLCQGLAASGYGWKMEAEGVFDGGASSSRVPRLLEEEQGFNGLVVLFLRQGLAV